MSDNENNKGNIEKLERKEEEIIQEEEEEEEITNKEFLKEFLENKPKEFIEFLKNNDIPLDSYNVQNIPRFIRIKPSIFNDSKQGINIVSKIENELKTKLIPLKWLPYFYRLENSSVNISSSNSYKSGIIYGMDASSGAAILALNPQPGDNVLDICCAPGTKLCMISDMLNGKGTVTGVDISDSRLGACKTILKKYKIPNARLFNCDGTKFNSLAPNSTDPIPMDKINENNRKKLKIDNNLSTTTTTTTNEDKENEEEEKSKIITFKKRKSSCKSKKKKQFDLENLYFSNTFFMRYSQGGGLYDKIIVDAECSLDASIRHLLKHSKISRNLNLENSKQLVSLQKGLIENAFNLLKPGGHLVYSTCSFSKEQNEFVVQSLLDKFPNSSKLIPSFNDNQDDDDDDDDSTSYKVPYSPGFIKYTYRFYPKNGTSGMFISKIEKIKTL